MEIRFKPLSVSQGRRLWLVSAGSYSNKWARFCIMSNFILQILPTFPKRIVDGKMDEDCRMWNTEIRSTLANRFVSTISETSSCVCEAIKLQDLNIFSPKIKSSSRQRITVVCFLKYLFAENNVLCLVIESFRRQTGRIWSESSVSHDTGTSSQEETNLMLFFSGL